MSKKLGTFVKNARTAKGLTQAALAEKVSGLTAADIGKAERAEKNRRSGKTRGAIPETKIPRIRHHQTGYRESFSIHEFMISICSYQLSPLATTGVGRFSLKTPSRFTSWLSEESSPFMARYSLYPSTSMRPCLTYPSVICTQ